MFRYLAASVALVCLSGDALAGCRAPLRRAVAAIVPGRLVQRDVARTVTRAPLIRRVAPASACGPMGCPVPGTAAPAPKGK